jgi:catechol 2,3-dioxygenase-like lactoylglutathione lyase family enzyme
VPVIPLRSDVGYLNPGPKLTATGGKVLPMDFKLELVQVPVTDVDRAIAFYVDKAGFTLDHDHKINDDLRFVQVTPPGSACSISFGVGLTDMAPGSLEGMQVVVSSAEDARDALAAGGVEVSEVQEFPWGRFVYFSDPDGNGWAVQELPQPS